MLETELPFEPEALMITLNIPDCIDIAAHKEDVFLEMIEAGNTFEST